MFSLAQAGMGGGGYDYETYGGPIKPGATSIRIAMAGTGLTLRRMRAALVLSW
jgi:hypothetical protein